MPNEALTRDAIDVWRAGVAAVDSSRLVASHVRFDGTNLCIGDDVVPLDDLDRVVVLGGGKAGAGMAAAVERVFADAGRAELLSGLVNVPADCMRPLERIDLLAARPAGVNEPREAGVQGTRRILELAHSLGPRDLALVLLSGGGSALLPAPVDGITLGDQQSITRLLAGAGASIGELNTVRKQLSTIKGGGLARAASGAARTIALVVSDVIGDPLDVIASGPTVPDPSTAAEAVAVLERLVADPNDVPASVWSHLRTAAANPSSRGVPDSVVTHVIGSNSVALAAAAERARELGYATHSLGSANEGVASDVGRELAELAIRIRDDGTPVSAPACVLSGGEPVVRLAETDRPRRGGRNQEAALAALGRLWVDGGDRIVVLSGGTDGEDGPTDAAGGIADADVLATARRLGLDPGPHLAINDSYGFLEPAGGLLVTGPTHTNVMDLRVVVVGT